MFSQLSLVVSDLNSSLAFYRRLGLTAEATPDGGHATAHLPSGLVLEWDTAEFAAQWDSGSRAWMSPVDDQHKSWPPRQAPV